MGIAFLSLASPLCRVMAQKEKVKENVLLHPDKFYRKFFPHLSIKRNPPDSLFIKSYPSFLSVGFHGLSPSMHVDIISRSPKTDGFDPTSKFRSNITDVAGFSGTYRFVSFGISFLSKSIYPHTDYSPSQYRTATVKYNGAADAFQFKYMRIKGFTDINQPNPLSRNPMYTQRPDVLNKEFQFEVIHNFNWKKYSYLAPITFSQRQLKSHGGFLLKAGVYYNQLSGDSTLIRQPQNQYYEDFNNVQTIRSWSIRVAPGLGGTLVFFEKIYFSVCAFASYNLYFYKYLKFPDEKVPGRQTFIFEWDGKVSMGYQSRRFFAGFHYEPGRRAGVLHSLEIISNYSFTGIDLGYRSRGIKF